MEFKYSLSLLFSNMGYVLKILGWVVACLLITACIGAAVLIPTFNALAEDPEVASNASAFAEDVQSFLDGEISISSFLQRVAADLSSLAYAVTDSAGLLAAIIILCIFLYCLYTFLIYTSYYPTSYIVNQLMSSNMRIGLAASLAMNFKTSVRFAACRVSIAVPIDIVLVAISGGVFAGLFQAIGLFALPITLALAVFLFSMRATMLAGWLPRMLFNPDESIYTAFARSLRSVKLNIKGLSKAFVITFFSTYAIVAGFSIPTFGLIIVVVPSINYFLLRVIELVGYYKMNGMSFYTDAANVVDTVEFGYRKENQTQLPQDVMGYADTDYAVDAYKEKISFKEHERAEDDKDAPQE